MFDVKNLELILNALGKDPWMGVESLANTCKMTVGEVYEACKGVGETPSSLFQQAIRIHRARLVEKRLEDLSTDDP